MWAQRAHCNAVDSYKCKGAFVDPLIRGDELTFHEPRIGVEAVAGFCSGLSVCGHSAERQVDLAHKSVEVGDGGRIPPFRVGTSRIGREGRAVDRARKIEVGRCAESIRLRVCNREGLPAILPLIVVIIVVIGERWSPNPRA